MCVGVCVHYGLCQVNAITVKLLFMYKFFPGKLTLCSGYLLFVAIPIIENVCALFAVSYSKRSV